MSLSFPLMLMYLPSNLNKTIMYISKGIQSDIKPYIMTFWPIPPCNRCGLLEHFVSAQVTPRQMSVHLLCLENKVILIETDIQYIIAYNVCLNNHSSIMRYSHCHSFLCQLLSWLCFIRKHHHTICHLDSRGTPIKATVCP